MNSIVMSFLSPSKGGQKLEEKQNSAVSNCSHMFRIMLRKCTPLYQRGKKNTLTIQYFTERNKVKINNKGTVWNM